ncbi:uncharacterized protein MYCFIDRAFT_175773 [Pseudocercospora fijiensis CIRAD86]|uniref:Uncharacterized protein n=1 Tax=Pseudocercospora fijiensis (strain CIRAD86) TaxID=383855 RepID=M3AYK7_PSEFD|nr:uncharacterized protein MYCFIDRAFT_175773 [Pseudocercospora fijiensis CIRAD86]EME82243.1 hypothetical protein MYCFIDRAFT_175773 [Pseudocercospora fijiensis CIRAD86]
MHDSDCAGSTSLLPRFECSSRSLLLLCAAAESGALQAQFVWRMSQRPEESALFPHSLALLLGARPAPQFLVLVSRRPKLSLCSFLPDGVGSARCMRMRRKTFTLPFQLIPPADRLGPIISPLDDFSPPLQPHTSVTIESRPAQPAEHRWLQNEDSSAYPTPTLPLSTNICAHAQLGDRMPFDLNYDEHSLSSASIRSSSTISRIPPPTSIADMAIDEIADHLTLSE